MKSKQCHGTKRTMKRMLSNMVVCFPNHVSDHNQPIKQPRTQDLSLGKTLAAAGHVAPTFWVLN
jgi:hypothetical protein